MKGKRWVVTLGWAAGAAALAVMVALLGAVPAAAAPPGPGTPIVYWVNDPGDATDANLLDGVCDTGAGALTGTGRLPCTLRAAIAQANNDVGPSVIAFEVCPTDFSPNPDGSYSIFPQQSLPALTAPNTYINGYTQGYPSPTPNYDDPATNQIACNGISPVPPIPLIARPNTNSFGQPMNTVLAVDVEGSMCVPPVPAAGSSVTVVPGGIVPSGSILPWVGVGACSGFTVLSSQNVIAGLNIQQWENAGILIMPSPVEPDIPTQNVIWGNFIGTTITGEDAIYNERFGVEIVGGVSETFIGETYYLSTTAFFPLQEYGWVEEPTNNERNLISGNANFARAYGSICALDNSVGSPPFYDDGAGVFIGYDPCIRADAGNSPHESDLLLGGGVWNEVRNNYIGTDLGGVYPISNTNGVWLNYEATNNHVGGCVKFPFTPGAPPVDPPPCQPHHTLDFEQDANLISGNIRHSDGMYVGGHGVWLNGTPLPHLVQASGVITNEIGGNFIGTDAMGREGLPNSGDGVYLRGGADLPHAPTRNEVGATTEHFDFHNAFRYGNLISSNGDINNTVFEDILPGYPFGPFNNGVELIGPGVMQNRIGYGNVIGLDSQLTNPLGNGDNGVLIWQGPAENYVHNNAGLNLSKPFVAGDIQSDAGAIGANGAFATAPGRSGVKIEGARLNAVFRNCIGGDGALCADSPTGLLLGNVWHGVVITNAAAMNTVGLNPTAGVTNTAIAEGNWIHHNGADGVAVAGDSSDQNTIRFNAIWLNGNPALGNLGIDLGDDGDTANDVGDPDTGPNQFQNYPDPVIDDAHWVVYFHSCVTCTVDIYATLETESDWPVNRGEGRYWLVSKQASGVTDTVDISATLATSPLGNPPTGNVCVTLTGTDADGNTSEFSDCQDAHFNPTAVLIRALRSVGIIPALLGGGLVLGGALGWRVWRRRRVRD